MHELPYFVSRTDQKLRFAKIQLDELWNHSSRNSGDDFERSHHESFLFHLYGAVDAFLQELNFYCDCGIALQKVSRQTLTICLRSRGRTSAILAELTDCEAVQGSALATAKQFRHHAAHRGGLPMQHYFNGPSNLVHPTTRVEIAQDSVSVLDGWLVDISQQLQSWRVRAQSGNI